MNTNVKSSSIWKSAWLVFGIALIMLLCALPMIPPFLYLAVAFFTFLIGNAQLKKGVQTVTASPVQFAAQPPVQSAATARVELPERKMPDNIPATLKCPSCGATVKPNAKQCSYCGSMLTPLVDLPEPAKLGALEIGGTVRVAHPHKGDQAYRVIGRLLYTELWQASRGATVPWTPTGNYFAGFALEQGSYLLNWQARFYILDERRGLTDMDINRDFAPYARQFAQSNQTADVEFAYSGGRWKMVDIGRFAIEFDDGEGLHMQKGAVGRFIHMSSGNQALVLEDFQSGAGGQDTLWKGFQINEADIKF